MATTKAEATGAVFFQIQDGAAWLQQRSGGIMRSLGIE
jgi:hypothetical protein